MEQGNIQEILAAVALEGGNNVETSVIEQVILSEYLLYVIASAETGVSVTQPELYQIDRQGGLPDTLIHSAAATITAAGTTIYALGPNADSTASGILEAIKAVPSRWKLRLDMTSAGGTFMTFRVLLATVRH